MVDYILIKREPEKIIQKLLDEIPEFKDSKEYKLLTSESRNILGLVCSSFAHFSERLILEHIKEEKSLINRCLQFIEWMSASKDSDLENYVITEIFEVFHDEMLMYDYLLPKSRQLYDRWCR